MAGIGTTTLAEARSQLRTLTQKYTIKKVSDVDLQWILNRTSYSVFVKLPRDVKEIWYGANAELTIAQDADTDYYDAPIPSDFWDIVGVKQYWTTAEGDLRSNFRKITFESLEEYLGNVFKTGKEYCIHGKNIITTLRSVAAGTVVCFYIRQLEEMTDDAHLVDIPDMYLSIVLYFAAIDVVLASEIDEKDKQVAIQMLMLKAKEASEEAGLKMQSTIEEEARTGAMGHPQLMSLPSGGGQIIDYS